MAKTKYTLNAQGQLQFPASTIQHFKHLNRAQRWGQAFHQFFELHKCVQDKAFCDKLYNEPTDEKARAMVASRTDQAQ